MEANILITGTKSGIGKYIHEQTGGAEFTRQSDIEKLKKQSFETIIHCAFNYLPTRFVTNENLLQYYSDNVLLTQELLQIPHRYFVFFSTVDLYPLDDQTHSEEEILYADQMRSIYGTTKLLSESLIRNRANKFLILRPTSLLGRHMRKNNFLRLVEDDYPVLTLHPESVFNFVLYSDIFGFLKTALSRTETGIFNLASSGGISLAKIAEILGKSPVFGDYRYKAGNISNQKAVRLCPTFSKSSEDVLNEFMAKKVISKT